MKHGSWGRINTKAGMLGEHSCARSTKVMSVLPNGGQSGSKDESEACNGRCLQRSTVSTEAIQLEHSYSFEHCNVVCIEGLASQASIEYIRYARSDDCKVAIDSTG